MSPQEKGKDKMKLRILLVMLCLAAPMLAWSQGSGLIEDSFKGTWQGVVCGGGGIGPFDATDNKNLAVDGKLPLFLKIAVANHDISPIQRSAEITVMQQAALNPLNQQVTIASAKFQAKINGPYQARNAGFANGQFAPRDAWINVNFTTSVASGQVGTLVLFSRDVQDPDTHASVRGLQGGVLITAAVGAGSITRTMEVFFIPAEGSGPAGYTALPWDKFVQKYMNYCNGHPANVEEKK
jgi:hypothetical protein